MKISVRRIWVFFLTTIIIYSIRAFFFQLALYRLVFPSLAVLILIFPSSRKAVAGKLKQTGRSAIFCWLCITIWGLFLAILHDTLSTSLDFLMWDLCFACINFCFLYYCYDFKLARVSMYTFFLIASIIGLSGIYESLTGRIYHVTYISYLHNRNAFGLLRPNTIFFNVNDNAVFMCMALIITYLLAEYSKRPRWLRIAALLIFGGNIILTESRGAEVGLFLFIYIYYMKSLSPRKKIVYVLAAIPLVAVLVPFIRESFVVSDINLSSLGGRGNVWRISLQNLTHTYLLGNGPGNTVQMNAVMARVAAIHNFYLEILCDYGVLGGIALAIWYIKLLRSSAYLGKYNICMTIVFAGLLSFIFLAVSSSSLVGKVWPISFFTLLTAEINGYEAGARDFSQK